MKKKSVKKEKKSAVNLAGLLPIICFKSRYSKLYSDTGRIGARMARQVTATTQQRALYDTTLGARGRSCIATRFSVSRRGGGGGVATWQTQTLRHGAPASACT